MGDFITNPASTLPPDTVGPKTGTAAPAGQEARYVRASDFNEHGARIDAAHEALLDCRAGLVAKDGGDASAALVTATGSTTARTLAARHADVVNVKDFGAVGDGVTDDTAAFTAIEALSAPEVFLPAGSYVVAGLALKKRYSGPGAIVLDGRTIYRGWSLDRGRQAAAEVEARIASMGLRAPGRQCAITRKDSTTLLLYRPLGGPWWQECQLATSAALPYSWNQTRVLALMSVVTAWDAGWTWNGAGWSDAYSGDPTRYVGGRLRMNATNGEYAEIAFTGGGDLYAIITKRTSGGFIRVSIDGDANAANVLPHDGTSRYIDCYATPDLQYRQRIKLATGLLHGSHTIRLTVTNTKNPASSGYILPLEGLGFVGRESGLPSQANTRAPSWATGVVTAQYQQVAWLGRNYSAAGAGTTGATPPTHTAGTVSDGGVSWTYMASSSYDLASHTIQAAGSQLEYAFQIKPDGASAFEDVGGLLHGNETLAALAVDVDGTEAGDPGIGIWLSGDVVSAKQAITTFHSEIGGGATNVADVVLMHRVTSAGVDVDHRHTWNVAASIGWCYVAMWPLLAYDGGSQRYTLDKMWTPQGGVRAAADYRGQANPIVGKSPDIVFAAWGDILGPNGSGGVPSASPGVLAAVTTMRVDSAGLAEYRQANNVFAGLAMNLSAADPTVNGYASHAMKFYAERVALSAPTAVAAAEVWRCSARYGLALVPDAAFELA